LFTWTRITLIRHIHIKKEWNSNEGLFKPISKGLLLIIINAVGENGFVPGAYARWKSNSNTDDYHHDMNFENYEKWVRTQLVPHLLPKSVVTIDK
jgi:hypothetical protein